MKTKKKKSGNGGDFQFQYKRPKAEAIRRRATQKGGMYDSIFKTSVPEFNPKEGTYRIRILPATWDNPEHYGYDIWMHYGIGADKGKVISLKKMKGEDDAIWRAYEKAQSRGDKKYADALRPGRRVGVYIIDRDDEKAGPQLWAMPWTLDRDITSLSEDRETNEVLCIDAPNKGYDVEFTREGTKKQTKYVGVRIARRSSPLSEDRRLANKWLKFISEHPIPDMLNYLDAKYIGKLFAGGGGPDEDEDDDGDTRMKTRKRRRGDEDEETPKKKRKKPPEEDDELDDDDLDDEDEDDADEDDESDDDESDDDDAEEDDDDADDDEDSDDDEDDGDEDDDDADDDDDEDEPPARKKKAKAKTKPAAKKKKRPADDDEDEDDEDSDDGDDDDEDDEEDSDEDDADEDDDESDDDGDDEDEDDSDDDEDDDEDEPPARKAKPGKKKRK